MSQFATKTFANATITSQTDYANALLYNIPEVLPDKLHRLQNCAVRLVTGDERTTDSILILKKLHKLPVRGRITYRIILLTFNALHGLASSYL